MGPENPGITVCERRVELMPVRQGVGRDQQYPRASGQELTLNKQGAQGARCAVQLRGERWSVLGSSGTADQPSVLRGLISSARAGTNSEAARAGCCARTWEAARRPQTIYSIGMRKPSAARPRLRLPCPSRFAPSFAIARLRSFEKSFEKPLPLHIHSLTNAPRPTRH